MRIGAVRFGERERDVVVVHGCLSGRRWWWDTQSRDVRQQATNRAPTGRHLGA
jgi:hypothetical protein